MSVASLGFQIDSGPLAATASELDKLTSSATRAEQAATRVSGAGTRMSRGFADLNPALDKIIGSLGRLEVIATQIDTRLGAMAQAASKTAKANQVLDQSAVEASTAYKQLEASLNAVQAAQRKGDASMASSLAMIEKQKDAIAKLNAELQKLRNAPSPAPGGTSNRPTAANNNTFATANVASQFQDVAVTAAMGMSPLQIALQQGTQLSSVLSTMGSGRQVVSGLAAAFTSLLSPISLATIGLTAGAAASIQYFSGTDRQAKTTDEVLAEHQKQIERVAALWGDAADKRSRYGQDSTVGVSLGLEGSVSALTKRLQDASKREGWIGGRSELEKAILSATTNPANLAKVGDRSPEVVKQISDFRAAVEGLRASAEAGTPDVLKFVDIIQGIGQNTQNPGIKQIAIDALNAFEPLQDLAKAMREVDAERIRLFNDRGSNGRLLSQGTTNRADAGNLALFESQQRVAAERNKQAFDARLYGIGARSPQERAEAARRSEAARYDNSETPAQRRTRIEQAGTLALAQAERQLADAQRDRAMDLDKILRDQENEIGLIGKAGGAAAALRKEYELTSALRLDAARQGIEVDQKELDLIHERAQALGQLVDQYSQAKFNFDMNQQAGDARLSSRDRRIVTTLRQYGLPEDLGGQNASRIGQQLDWQDAKDMAKGFGSAFGSELISGSHDLGQAVLKGLEAGLENQATKLWEKFFDNLGNLFADWLTGSKGGGTGGALGSVATAALGGGLSAANSNGAGGFSGLAKVIPVTRSPLPDITAKGDIASYIANAASARGIDPNIALRVAKSEGGLSSWNLQSNFMKNGVQEPSFGPFQLYKGGGLGNAFMAKTGLDPALAANGPAGVDFALDHAAKNGWGAWYGARNAGIGNWEGIGAGGASTATEAVDKLASSAGAATKGLDTFGGGLGKLGNALGSAFPAAPAAGGGGGLASIFGGLFGNPTGFSSQARLLAPLAGTGVGLFADGTNYAPGGMAIVGERGPELINLPQGSQVFNTNRTAQMLGGGGQGGGIAGVRVYVDQDGNWQAKVESISEGKAQNASRQSLAGYQKTQERGGFGRDQQTYMKRKG